MDTIKRAQKNPVAPTTGNQKLSRYYYDLVAGELGNIPAT